MGGLPYQIVDTNSKVGGPRELEPRRTSGRKNARATSEKLQAGISSKLQQTPTQKS